MQQKPVPPDRPPATGTTLPRTRSRQQLLFTVLGLLMLVCTATARSADEGLEYAVKATYLCKLPGFVVWPPTALTSDSFVLCVIGRSPFGELLDRAAQGQTAQQRPIEVRRYTTVTGNPGCHLMFVAGSDGQPVAAVLAAVHGTPVLTVTDSQIEAASTGVINFVLADNHVRFEIDQQSAAESGLVISSKLLSLATRVSHRLTQ